MTEQMIDVTVIETGTWVEAETPEDALCAALTIGREARQHRALQGYDPMIRFSVDGETVRVVSLRSLSR